MAIIADTFEAFVVQSFPSCKSFKELFFDTRVYLLLVSLRKNIQINEREAQIEADYILRFALKKPSSFFIIERK